MNPSRLEVAIRYVSVICALLLIVLIMANIQGCKTTEVEPPAPPPKPAPKPIAISWDNQERKAWSEYLLVKIEGKKLIFDSAKDITLFCPKYASLDNYAQTKALAEFWVALAYFESGWNPKSSSVDVGTPGDKDTYSVGLYQMSVVDQVSYKLPLGYKYADLITAKPNIHLAIEIMAKQIKSKGLIVVPKNPYWAVLYRGKYDKIASIISYVKKTTPVCFN